MKASKSLSELISLTGKKALITGSALGIGRAMAYRFAEAGADLELVDINERGLRTIADELSDFKVKPHPQGEPGFKRRDSCPVGGAEEERARHTGKQRRNISLYGFLGSR